MEKLDLGIAVAGAVVLVVAIAGSAVYGGTGGAANAFDVTYPAMTMDLAPQSFDTQGSGEGSLTFDVDVLNVTSVAFSASSSPAGAASPTYRFIVTAPDGRTFEGDGASFTVDVADAPAAHDAHAASADDVTLPEPVTNGTGAWNVVVQLTSPASVPVPYTVTVSASVTHYEASVRPDLPPPAR